MYMQYFYIDYINLDGNIKTHKINAESLWHAESYAEVFCKHFGFKLNHVYMALGYN